MVHEPGPRQELGRWKKNPQQVPIIERTVRRTPHARISISLGFLDEVWSGMDECMISVVWRCLSEGGCVREQVAVVITRWDDEVLWMSYCCLNFWSSRQGFLIDV